VLLQLRVTVPPDLTGPVRELFEKDAGTAHIALLLGAALAPAGATWSSPTWRGKRRTA
jgi:hypothetical protein